MTVLFTIAPDKALFQPKSNDIFLISSQKYMLWYSLKAHNRGFSNEYPQHIFSLRNKKSIMGIRTLIWRYDSLNKGCCTFWKG